MTRQKHWDHLRAEHNRPPPVLQANEQQEASSKYTAPKKPDKPLFGLRLLLVEDSPDNQNLFRRMLEAAGASVDLAENGLVAVRLDELASRRGKRHDAVIMDVRMPVMDGYRATEWFRRRGYKGPIIALTAHAVPGEEGRCRQAGCSHFLTKPIDRFQLIGTLAKACIKQPCVF